MKLKRILFIGLTFTISLSCAQRGINGNKLINAAGTIVNEFTTLTADAAAGSTTINVAASGLNSNARFPATLAPGDLIMVIQMQGATILGAPDAGTPTISNPNDATWGGVTSYNNSGKYEFCEVSAVPAGGTTITIDCGLANSYTAAGRVQVIRVPRYNTLTITSPGVLTTQAWSGTTGGVVAVEVSGSTTINAGGKISATGLGFRGGALFTTTGRTPTVLYSCVSLDVGTNKGEGIAGYDVDYTPYGGKYCRGAAANAGGGGNVWNCGGGGGGNGGNTAGWNGQGNPDNTGAGWSTAWNLEFPGFAGNVSSGGGRGGYSFSNSNQNATTLGPGTIGVSNAWGGSYRYNLGGLGGRPLDYSTGRIFLGGGGGAGEQDNNQGGAGAKGGGIIFLTTYGTIAGTGTDSIVSNGANGGSTKITGVNTGVDGAGGAGAGGAIILNSSGVVSGVFIQANGGIGGNQRVNLSPSEAEGPGGGGGGGYIAVAAGTPTQQALGGANGITFASQLSEFTPNGATKGGIGTTNQTISKDTISAANVTICGGTTATLTAVLTGSIPATITWYNAQTGGVVLGTGPTFTTPVLGSTTTYYVGFCPGTYRIPVVVTVAAGLSITVNSPTICSGQTANLTASGGTSYSWSTGATSTGVNTATAAPAVTTSYTVTGTTGGCSGTAVATVTVNTAPTTANAGPDQSVCGTSATFAGNTAASGAGTWTLISGSGTITTPSSPTSGVTGLGIGANVFQWTITNAPCTPTSDQVTITAAASPTVANAGPDQSVCSTTATLAGNTAAVGTGTWTLVSGAGSITTPSSPTSGVTGLGVGANVFQWTIANTPCTATTDQITITRAAPPTVADAGVDQTLCGSTINLAGNPAAVGAGTWTLISGAGTITTPSSPSSGVTGLGVGANVFQWTITNSPCPSSSDQVTINITSTPTVADAGPDQTVCGTSATLAGNAAVVGTGAWVLVSGSGTVTTPSSPTSAVTSLGVGANVFQWTITNGACTPTSDQVTVIGTAVPTVANAGPDQAVCGTTATLAGNTAAVGIGTWTLVSGAGTIAAPSSPTSGITGLGTGANVFQWTITNAPCAPTSDQVTITGTAVPTVANAGPDQSVCGTTATLAGNAAVVGAGTWTLVSGAGSITTPSSPTSGITGLGAGANVFQWTISNGSCPPTSDQVTITGTAVPTVAAAGSDQSVCGTTATLAGNTAAIGTGTWTLVSGAGSITTLSSPTSGLTGLGTGANVFQWTITNGVCPPTSDQVTITANPVPDATITPVSPVCLAAAPFNLTAATGGGTWTGTGITSGSAGTFSPASSGVGTFTITYTIPGVCPSSDTILISVSTNLDATITTVAPVCLGTAAFNMSAATAGGTWTGTGITSGSAGTFSPASSGVGTFTITYTISGSCGNTDTALVTVGPNTDATITQPAALCVSASPISLSAANPGGTWSGTGITSASAGTFDPSVAGIGSYIITYGIPGTCGATDTVIVTVNATADATITAAGPVCSGTSAFNLSSATPGGVWSGTGITSSSAGTFDPSSAGVGSHIITYTISGSCGNIDTTIVSVIAQANAAITATSPVCGNTASYTLTAVTPGGTWTGTGVSSAGVFDPSLATVGTNTITYSIAGVCGDTATKIIIVNAVPTPNFTSGTATGCAPLCVTFNESASNNCSSVIYSFGDGNTSTSSSPSHCYGVSGSYSVSISCTDVNNCTGSTTITNMINVLPTPTAGITVSPTGVVPTNTVVTFTDVSTGGGSQSWDFGDPSSGGNNTSVLSAPTHTYSAEGTYCVNFVSTNASGCADTVNDCIVVANDATFFIPNVFTPNGDGNNDVFKITATSVESLTCSIYDRWGLKMAEWNTINGSWDGRTTSGSIAPNGVYYYILKATAINGKETQEKGFLQLLGDK